MHCMQKSLTFLSAKLLHKTKKIHEKESLKKEGDILPGPVLTGQGTMVLNRKEIDLDWI